MFWFRLTVINNFITKTHTHTPQRYTTIVVTTVVFVAVVVRKSRRQASMLRYYYYYYFNYLIVSIKL